MTPPVAESCDVLVIGGGPTGLVSALALARQGLHVVVIERHTAAPTHAKAHEVNGRSLEILLSLGLDFDQLRASATPFEHASRVMLCGRANEVLAHLDLRDWGAGAVQSQVRSPEPYLNLSQIELEKLLRAQIALEPGIDLRLGSRWETMRETERGVVSRITAADGHAVELESAYAIAADGARSQVRGLLGIEYRGIEKLQDVIAVQFESELSRWVTLPAKLTWFVDPVAFGVLISHDGARRWVFHVPLFTPWERAADMTPEHLERLLREALVLPPQAAIDIKSVASWQMGAQVASAFRKGRTFLAGDAAHCFPPTGGLGLNTGVADAWNLAWKLGAVLNGHAAASLLESYEAERRPAAERACEESVKNFSHMARILGVIGLDLATAETMARLFGRAPFSWMPVRWRQGLRRTGARLLRRRLRRSLATPWRRMRIEAAMAGEAPHFLHPGLDLGLRYTAGALVDDERAGRDSDGAVSSGKYVPSTRPGARLPHFWIDEQEQRSSHDLIDSRRLVLVVGRAGNAWARALGRDETGNGVNVNVVAIDALARDEGHAGWLRQRLQITSEGALLVRPDGHVAWRRQRAAPAGSVNVLPAAVDRILGHPERRA